MHRSARALLCRAIDHAILRVLVLGLIAFSCARPTPTPATADGRAAEDRRADGSATEPGRRPRAHEGRLFVESGRVCAALPSGIFCRGRETHHDALGRPARLTARPDFIDLRSRGELVCARRRAGPATCWRLTADGHEEWELSTPAVAVSVEALEDGQACALGDAGDLWCGAFGTPPRRVSTPEPIVSVRWSLQYEKVCVLGRSKHAHCAADAASEWREDNRFAEGFSSTIGCLLKDGVGKVCAWRDENDAEAIAIAGHERGPRFANAIELDFYLLRGHVLLDDGRLAYVRDEADWAGDPFTGDRFRDAPEDIVEVDGLGSSVCVLTASDAVWCRGENSDGELGRGSASSTPTPTRLTTRTFDEVRAGTDVTCARARNGRWWCSDYDESVEARTGDRGLPLALAPAREPCSLERGAVVCESYPGGPRDRILTGATEVSGLRGVGCARRKDGRVACWAKGEDGESVVTSTAFETLGVAMDERGRKACVVQRDGSLWCWGELGCSEQLGAGTPPAGCDSLTRINEPTKVANAPKATAVAVGDAHTCVLTPAGGVECRGDNWVGQLGDGSLTARSTFAQVPGLARARAIAAAGQHTCALVEDGSLWCWGDNSRGQTLAGRVDVVPTFSPWPTGAAQPGYVEQPAVSPPRDAKPPPRPAETKQSPRPPRSDTKAGPDEKQLAD